MRLPEGIPNGLPEGVSYGNLWSLSKSSSTPAFRPWGGMAAWKASKGRLTKMFNGLGVFE